MLKIILKVPSERDRAALLEIADGMKTLIEDSAVATSATGTTRPGSAQASRRIRGHPPLGRYELTARGRTPGGAETEYGPELLMFEPIGGPALEAEAQGRLGLLVYSGSAGRDMSLRRTQGGVRLSRRAMELLLQNIGDDTEVELHLEELTPRPWWAFWRKHRTPDSLSKDPPRLTAPPYDEESVAAQLTRSAVRRARPTRRDNDDDDRWRDRDSSSGSSRDSSSDFRGAGGAGGGGGASGGWSEAPAAGRGPGVTAAGVIVGAAGAAAVAAAASAQNDSRSGHGQSDASGSWSNDSASGDSTGGGAGGDSPSTTTSTSY